MKTNSKVQNRNAQELLRKLREDAGLRQVDLALRLKKPQSYVSKYESGEKTLSFLEVREVCKALGVSMVDFVQLFEGSINEG